MIEEEKEKQIEKQIKMNCETIDKGLGYHLWSLPDEKGNLTDEKIESAIALTQK